MSSSEPAQAPSESYLRACNKPGALLGSRKLLVLDLDGTLVCRVSILPSIVAPPHPTTTTESPPGMQPSTQRSCTTPHFGSRFEPRPFVDTLISYLLHPDTTKWLTTMVWSLSKRSNVDEMVQACFGPKYKHLAAIWSREDLNNDLGRGEGEASRKIDARKVQSKAIKDLERIWNINDLSSMQLISSSICSALNGFSQINTVLLDDTPRKAANQPFNYIPISKFRSFIKPRGHQTSTQSLATQVAHTTLDSSLTNTLFSYTSSSAINSAPALSTKASEGTDPSLLAVIGILSVLRDVPNVSYWIKKGGLVRLSAAETREVPSNPGLGRIIIPENSIDESKQTKTRKQNNVPWHEMSRVHRHWVDQGRREAERLGLTIIS